MPVNDDEPLNIPIQMCNSTTFHLLRLIRNPELVVVDVNRHVHPNSIPFLENISPASPAASPVASPAASSSVTSFTHPYASSSSSNSSLNYYQGNNLPMEYSGYVLPELQRIESSTMSISSSSSPSSSLSSSNSSAYDRYSVSSSPELRVGFVIEIPRGVNISSLFDYSSSDSEQSPIMSSPSSLSEQLSGYYSQSPSIMTSPPPSPEQLSDYYSRSSSSPLENISIPYMIPPDILLQRLYELEQDSQLHTLPSEESYEASSEESYVESSEEPSAISSDECY